MKNIFIIAPDKASGEKFKQVLLDNAVKCEMKIYKIAPRVIVDKINDSQEVVSDFENALIDAKRKNTQIVIACNTLQFWLDRVNKEILKGIKVYTTFDACLWKFKDSNVKPLWLGTTPTASLIKHFDTLMSLKRYDMQDITQQLIWRIKKYYEMDIRTAPSEIFNDESSKKLQLIKIQKLKDNLKIELDKLEKDTIILGCTELPLVFNEFVDPAKVLAEYIIEQNPSSKN